MYIYDGVEVAEHLVGWQLTDPHKGFRLGKRPTGNKKSSTTLVRVRDSRVNPKPPMSKEGLTRAPRVNPLPEKRCRVAGSCSLTVAEHLNRRKLTHHTKIST